MQCVCHVSHNVREENAPSRPFVLAPSIYAKTAMQAFMRGPGSYQFLRVLVRPRAGRDGKLVY